MNPENNPPYLSVKALRPVGRSFPLPGRLFSGIHMTRGLLKVFPSIDQILRIHHTLFSQEIKGLIEIKSPFCIEVLRKF